jgi:hypothetical protein
LLLLTEAGPLLLTGKEFAVVDRRGAAVVDKKGVLLLSTGEWFAVVNRKVVRGCCVVL